MWFKIPKDDLFREKRAKKHLRGEIPRDVVTEGGSTWNNACPGRWSLWNSKHIVGIWCHGPHPEEISSGREFWSTHSQNPAAHGIGPAHTTLAGSRSTMHYLCPLPTFPRIQLGMEGWNQVSTSCWCCCHSAPVRFVPAGSVRGTRHIRGSCSLEMPWNIVFLLWLLLLWE